VGPESSPERVKILLADDDDDLRTSFVRQLVRLGHEVEPFPSGVELCERIRESPLVDLVWSDLEMPGADGFEVMEVAREFLPKIPVLIVSGHTDADHLMRALHAGATGYLQKPYEMAELIGVLRRVEALRMADRNEERAWGSLRGSALLLQMPPSIGVAAAVATMLRNHAKPCLGASECHGLHIATHELLLNAVEHGCLEITGEEKREALRKNAYRELVMARQAEPRFAGRTVHIRFTAALESGVDMTITDPGPGFDASTLPDLSDAESLFLPSGRGIVLAGLHVDELLFSDGGRTAKVRIFRRSLE
jgi:two-component system cell cycle response regulator